MGEWLYDNYPASDYCAAVREPMVKTTWQMNHKIIIMLIKNILDYTKQPTMKEGQDFLPKDHKQSGENAYFLSLTVPIVFMLLTRAS